MAQMEPGSIRDVILRGARRLQAAGIPTPRLDAELLLAQALGASRSSLLAMLPDAPPPDALRAYDPLLERRARREPIAYITGEHEFWGRPFVVTPDVLIPRPETELLVERALALARPGDVVADVGTGSGCIAVSVALARPDVRVYATDTSPRALAVAGVSAERHGAPVTFLEGPLLSPLPEQPDLVLANLPYVPAPAGEIG